MSIKRKLLLGCVLAVLWLDMVIVSRPADHLLGSIDCVRKICDLDCQANPPPDHADWKLLAGQNGGAPTAE